MGWYLDQELTTLWNFKEDRVDKDITLYAGYKLTDYTVIFVDDTREVGVQRVPYNGLLTPSELPYREGYTFDGWYQDEAFPEAWGFALDRVDKNLYLYAKWDQDVEPLTPVKPEPEKPEVVPPTGIASNAYYFMSTLVIALVMLKVLRKSKI